MLVIVSLNHHLFASLDFLQQGIGSLTDDRAYLGLQNHHDYQQKPLANRISLNAERGLFQICMNGIILKVSTSETRIRLVI